MNDIERTHRIWLLAKDKDGQIDLLEMTVHCTPAEADRGVHIDLASAMAQKQGLDVVMALDENSPASRRLQDLVNMQAIRKQDGPAGLTVEQDPDAAVWEVPLTVDMSLSATIQVRAGDRSEAIALAKEFASSNGFGLFSLDEGNYRGASDFYVGDADGVCELEPSQPDDVQAVQAAVRPRQG